MKLGLINSAWAQSGRDTAFGIRMTKEIGFDTIDIFADPLDVDARERRLIRRECEKAGLPIVSVACVAVGLIDFNPSVQRFHVERCRRYLDMCYEFEARNLLLVLGEYIWERQVIPPAEQWQTAVRNVRELGKYAADLGLQIALELEPFKLSLLNNVDSMVRFLDDVNHPAVRANIDVSHLQLSRHAGGGAAPSCRAGRSTSTSATATARSTATCRPVAASSISRPTCVRSRRSASTAPSASSWSIRRSRNSIVEWVREAYEATDRLMRAAGLRG